MTKENMMYHIEARLTDLESRLADLKKKQKRQGIDQFDYAWYGSAIYETEQTIDFLKNLLK